jgi:glutathione S-transferase
MHRSGAAKRDDDGVGAARRAALSPGSRRHRASGDLDRKPAQARARQAYLCGAPSIADAFYAPVAFRFQTYRWRRRARRAATCRRCSRTRSCASGADAVAETIVIEPDEPRFVYRDKLAGRA